MKAAPRTIARLRLPRPFEMKAPRTTRGYNRLRIIEERGGRPSSTTLPLRLTSTRLAALRPPLGRAMKRYVRFFLFAKRATDRRSAPGSHVERAGRLVDTRRSLEHDGTRHRDALALAARNSCG